MGRKNPNNNLNRSDLFQLETASFGEHSVSFTSSITLTPMKAIEDVGSPELIIVPGFMFNILAELPALQTMSQWLLKMHNKLPICVPWHL